VAEHVVGSREIGQRGGSDHPMSSLATTTATRDRYPLSTEMVRLAEDGTMFKIARFRKTIEARFRAEILVLACG
jgi:hypothetical protein